MLRTYRKSWPLKERINSWFETQGKFVKCLRSEKRGNSQRVRFPKTIWDKYNLDIKVTIHYCLPHRGCVSQTSPILMPTPMALSSFFARLSRKTPVELLFFLRHLFPCPTFKEDINRTSFALHLNQVSLSFSDCMVIEPIF